MSPAPVSVNRQQILLLAGILAAGGLFALYTFVWQPLQASRAARMSETAQLRDKIDKARKDLKQEPAVRREIEEIRAELGQIRRDYIPSAVMGSSQILDVQSRLEGLSKASGFIIDNMREVGRRPLPRKLVVVKPPPVVKPAPGAKPAAAPAVPARPKAKGADKKAERPAAFESFVTEVGGLAGYGELVEFLRQVEASNPYVCITGLDVQSRPEDVTQHRILIQMEWPVEAPPPPVETKPAAPVSAPGGPS